MSNTRWRDSLPPPQPTRHRVRARQDFEDSITADRLDTLAHPGLAMAAQAMAPRSRIAIPPVSAELKAALPWADQAPRVDALQASAPDLPGVAASETGSRPAPVKPSRAGKVGFIGLAFAVCLAAWEAVRVLKDLF
jgi:hypothetical protein